MSEASKSKSKRHLAFGVEPNSRRYRLRLARYAALAETIAERVKSGKSSTSEPLRLLDAGAGNGRTMQYLEPYAVEADLEFHAIEYDERRINRMYGRERWEKVIQGDLNDGITYPDSHFDIVICEQVLEHLDSPEPVLQELIRVLKPEGQLIIGVPTFPPGLATIRRYVIPQIDRLFGRERGHSQVFTAGRLRAFIDRQPQMKVDQVRGFRIISGGILTPLENTYWWYRLNRRIGQLLPSLCVECQAIASKFHLYIVSVLALG